LAQRIQVLVGEWSQVVGTLDGGEIHHRSLPVRVQRRRSS
jgi:hypothetical protein